MLDERGVAWVAIDESMTEYTQEGIVYRAYEVYDGLCVAIVTPVTPEQAIAATVGRSCASCPEMDNPDSYISHLHAALKWHDEHVPIPTNPINTCVVLEGEKVPEEVLFIGANDVTHYLPEGAGTCQNNGFVDDGGWYFVCSKCGCEFEYADFACEFTEGYGLGSPKFCPNCGRKVV